MILQIETGQPGIVPTDLFLPHEPFQQPLFRHPIEFSDQLIAVLHEQPQRLGPFAQDPIGFRIMPANSRGPPRSNILESPTLKDAAGP